MKKRSRISSAANALEAGLQTRKECVRNKKVCVRQLVFWVNHRRYCLKLAFMLLCIGDAIFFKTYKTILYGYARCGFIGVGKL